MAEYSFGAIKETAPWKFTLNETSGMPYYITGIVRSDSTGLPLNAAHITASADGSTITGQDHTKIDGSYIINIGFTGNYTIKLPASLPYSGYQQRTEVVSVTSAGITTRDFSLYTSTLPIDGACGSANGQAFDTAPTFNLCTTGSLSATPTTLPWTWSCSGSDGGATANCSASINTYLLAVTVTGTGNGTVTSVPASISCITGSGNNCSANFNFGTNVNLIATPNTNPAFGGWSGACNNSTGDCAVNMDAGKNVTASFNLSKVRINGNSNAYSTISDAYAAVADGGTIKARTLLFIENLVLNRNLGFTLSGGYDDGFNLRTDYTTVQGKVTLSGSGRVVVDRLKIR